MQIKKKWRLDRVSNIIKNFKNIKYGPALEDNKDVYNWITNLNKPNKLYINGKWIKAKSKKTIQSINPANNSKLFKVKLSKEIYERI